MEVGGSINIMTAVVCINHQGLSVVCPSGVGIFRRTINESHFNSDKRQNVSQEVFPLKLGN